jgi:hypothetical protein
MTEASQRPRQLLVLAASGAFGGGMRDPSQASLWPDLIRGGLESRFGDVDLTLRRFYVHSGQPMEYLERELARLQPDFIVMQCTSFPATQKTVAHRVERLLGKGLADWTEARVRTVDQATRRRGRVRHKLNRAGHIAARRIIGTSPMVPLKVLLEGYGQAIDRIARVESAQVAIVGTGMASAAARRNNREIETIKARFDGAIREAARKKHLAWVDSAAITREADDPEAMFLDMLHKGQAWHDGVAAGVLAAFLRD